MRIIVASYFISTTDNPKTMSTTTEFTLYNLAKEILTLDRNQSYNINPEWPAQIEPGQMPQVQQQWNDSVWISAIYQVGNSDTTIQILFTASQGQLSGYAVVPESIEDYAASTAIAKSLEQITYTIAAAP